MRLRWLIVTGNCMVIFLLVLPLHGMADIQYGLYDIAHVSRYSCSSSHGGTLLSQQNTLPAASEADSDEAKNTSLWKWLEGKEPESHLYLGMWTWHFNSKSRKEDRWQNELIGFNYKSFFAATFLNSFSQRTYVAGIQRDVLKRGNDIRGYAIGYRVGGVYGYDKKFGRIAAELPVLPLIQPYIAMHYHHVGVELSYIGVVFTAEFFIRF